MPFTMVHTLNFDFLGMCLLLILRRLIDCIHELSEKIRNN
jgi:hypothetical protein